VWLFRQNKLPLCLTLPSISQFPFPYFLLSSRHVPCTENTAPLLLHGADDTENTRYALDNVYRAVAWQRVDQIRYNMWGNICFGQYRYITCFLSASYPGGVGYVSRLRCGQLSVSSRPFRHILRHHL
jgi:hypothetical protein